MTRLKGLFVATALVAGLAMPALAQQGCATNEGLVVQYSLGLDDSGVEFFERYASPRVASSVCTAGAAAKTMFRNVDVDLKSRGNVAEVIEAAAVFAKLGINDEKAIKQIVDAVAAGVKRGEALKKNVAGKNDKATSEPFTPFGGNKK